MLALQPADSHQALVARLFLDQPDHWRRSADLAHEGGVTTAAFASDLAGIYLWAARDPEGVALDAARALHYAQQALSLAPRQPEALFNRALALERLEYHEAAARAWDDYLTADRKGDWADEARSRARNLRQAAAYRLTQEVRDRLAAAIEADEWPIANDLVTRIPQAAREHLDDTLLPAWSEAIRRGDLNRAARSLDQIRRVGSLLMTRHGERAWYELADALTQHTRPRRDELASAVLDLKQARLQAERNQLKDARTLLDRTGPRVVDVPPLDAAVQFWRLYVEWYGGDRKKVALETDWLARDCEARRFIYLQGRALNLLASTLNSLTRYSEGQIASRHAAEVLTLSGEREYAASAQASLGSHLALQGDMRKAWSQQRQALSSLRHIDSARRRFVVLSFAVVLGSRFGLPHAGIALQAASIEEAYRWNDTGGLVRGLIERARLHFDLDNRDAARDDLVTAEQNIGRMNDVSFKKQHEDDLRMARARLLERDNPAAAALLLTEAIKGVSERGRPFQLTELYLSRGRAWARAGNEAAALEDWRLGMEKFEEQSGDLRDEQLRISHFARAWELYRDATALLVARGEIERALALLERGHARALRDSILPGETPDIVEPRGVAASLPEGVLVLVYRTLPRELLVWSLDRGGIALHRVPVASADLRRLTTRFSDRADGVFSPDVLDRLGDLLLGSVRERLQRARSLVIVPDAMIAGVPFAALPLPDGTGPLVTRVPVTLTPSLSLLDITTRRLNLLKAGSLHSAFFADPIPAPGNPELPRLLSAQREIEKSASVYAGAQTFIGRDATEARLLDAMGTVDVLHFAGHALGNAEYPSRSRLLASPEPSGAGSGDGDVLPQEIAARNNPRARLVLLSACSTATGTPAFGEGVLSLARPFLAAGVPQVVGTLWDIGDRAGEALMPRFHHWYSQGVGAAEALRRAQLELRTSGDPVDREVRTWAAFVVVGGLNRFPVHEGSH